MSAAPPGSSRPDCARSHLRCPPADSAAPGLPPAPCTGGPPEGPRPHDSCENRPGAMTPPGAAVSREHAVHATWPYTPAEQQRRERVRLEAAGRFARGDTIKEI